MIDRRGRLLLVALEAARLRLNVHPLPALRSWLDSWNGLGAVVTGTTRVSFDTPKVSVPRSFHGTTRRGRVGQVLSFSATPWRAVQVAARETLRKAE
jgi:hypothetical protein